MAIEEVGVRLIAENEAQFQATMKRANSAVENFGSQATKSAKNLQSKWSSLMTTLSSPEGMRFMVGAAGSVVGALTAVGVSVKKLADDYMNYAFQVKDFGRIIGATPEEASRLIQVADDVRLSVGSMTIAMRTAINKGYRPTVEGLGQLSEAYLAIQDPIARSRFLTDTFGRSGLEMAKLMELGSDKIREMGASVESGLIVTQKGIDQATAYYQELDKLTDSWTALRNSAAPVALEIAIKGVKGLNEIANDASTVGKMFASMQRAAETGAAGTDDILLALTGYMAATRSADQITQDFNARMGIFDTTIATITPDMMELTRSTTNQAYAAGVLSGGLVDMNERLRQQAIAQAAATDAVTLGSSEAWKASDAYQAMSSGIASAQAAADKVKAVEVGLEFKMPNIADQMRNLIKSIDWKAAGGGALETFMQGFAAKAGGLGAEAQKEVAKKVGAVDISLQIKTGDLTKSEGIKQLMDLSGMKWGDASKLLSDIANLQPADIGPFLDGIVALADQNNTKKAADDTLALSENIGGTGTAITLNQGLLSGWVETTLNLGKNAQEAAAQVGAVNTQLKSMPKVVDVKINISTSGSTTPAKTRRRAEGGFTYADTAYLIGERGPELFIPDTSGEVIPNNRTMAMLDDMLTLIPMAKGGKIGAGSGTAWEKAHNKAVKEREAKNKKAGMAGDEMGDIEEQGSSALEAIQAREEYTWSALRMNVAEYNALIKAGASPAVLAEKKRVIDAQGVEAQALTKLRAEAELQNNLLKSQQDGTAEGLEQSSLWLQNLMNKFKDFFALLTSAAAKSAMDIINPLVSSSPAPLALGLSQIRSQMDKLSGGSLPRFGGSIAQLAAPSQITNSRSSVYNINVPVTATVSNQADIKILAYAVAKEIATNVRS